MKVFIKHNNQHNLLKKLDNKKWLFKQQQPLDYRFVVWDRHIKYVTGLNHFVSAQLSIYLGTVVAFFSPKNMFVSLSTIFKSVRQSVLLVEEAGVPNENH